MYKIGNIFCLEILGGCEGPAAPPPVYAPVKIRKRLDLSDHHCGAFKLFYLVHYI